MLHSKRIFSKLDLVWAFNQNLVAEKDIEKCDTIWLVRVTVLDFRMAQPTHASA